MAILGASDNSEQFLRSLDERKLVDLCADLLTIEGHSEITVTEGPGDGQRDIHSRTPNGENHLTQAKFHADPSRTVSAKELGEVVLGMARFGYQKGLFITNARISPSAKRDCLNDYPDYSVDFIEGWGIVKRIFDNLVLKAIWYDGTSIDRISYALIVPVVARDLESDRPLPLLPCGHESSQGGVLEIGRTKVQASFHRSWVNLSAFGEYRSPRVRTIRESGRFRSNLTEIVLSGAIHLQDIGDLLPKIGMEVVRHLLTMYGDTKKHFAVVIGQPCLTPLSGAVSGARIELKEYNPTSLVCHDDVLENELDWLLPTQECGWFAPEQAKVSQSHWVRWYNPRIDACLDILLTSTPSDAVRWMIEEQNDFFARWWNESLFILLPDSLQGLLKEMSLPEPSYWYRWDSDSFLGGWLHPYFACPIRPMQIESDYGPIEPSPFQLDFKQVQSEFESLQTQLEGLGGVVVEPTKARHMIALLEQDPFPATETFEYQSCHLMFESDIIPSPIDPKSRRMVLTVCWLTEPLANDSSLSEAELDQLANAVILKGASPFRAMVEFDEDTLSGETYLLAHIEYSRPISFEKTTYLLQRIEGLVTPFLDRLESALGPCFGSVQRATRKYWDEEILMTFKSAQ